MRRRELLGSLVGATVGLVSAAAAQEAPKKPRGTFQAERAGWLLGMYVGEERGLRHPFVTELDPKGEAKAKGVRSGDEIIRLNEEEVLDLGRFHKRIKELRAGEFIELWVRRGGQTLRFEMRVPKNHAPLPEDPEKAQQAKDAAANPEEDKKKKGKKKRGPVVIKPIPAPNP
ncbi:MAG: PDZ domain-containing protein [Armatimonadetes bacterium]|nr:PDZ domain-containing protein [Armatimonadota bacterium]